MCYNIISKICFAKEADFMKKLFSSIAVAALLVCMSITAFTATSSISIKNNDNGVKPVTFNYDEGKTGETVTSIKPLMTKLDDLSKNDSVVQTLTITSENTGTSSVSLKLRLSIPERTDSNVKPEAIKTPSPDEYSALDYYNIKITDKDGNIVYSYEDDEKSDENHTYKDMFLGVLNEELSNESKIYNLTISVNKDLNKSDIQSNAERLDWSIVSDTYIKETKPTPAPTHVPTPAPTPTPTEIAVETAMPTPEVTTPPSGVKEDKNGVITLAKGEYLCGKDIDPGKYTITGSGKVHVYTSEGALKSTIALKNKNDSSANGVDEYLINLLEGEKVTVDSDIKFTPYDPSKATATPIATEKATKSNTATATATPKASNSDKTNPKTGDTAPIAAVSLIAMLAIAAFTFIEIKKRKNN